MDGTEETSAGRGELDQMKPSTLNIANTQIGTLIVNNLQENVPPELSPIIRVRQPISNMKETETFKEISNQVSLLKKCILHCWGVPGSGKSQIVRKLAEKFPFTLENGQSSAKDVIKWHIQCKDSGHDVEEELKKLTDELHKNSHVTNVSHCESIKTALVGGSPQKLIEKLRSSNFPVLIIVEDPDCDKTNPGNKLLQEFIRTLSSIQTTEKPIHFYLTSRTHSPILEVDETDGMEIYQKISIIGFDQSKALQFLQLETGKDLNQENREAAIQIYKWFSGLPLGLHAARAFCRDARIDYTVYLDFLKNTDYDIIQEEEDFILKEYGDKAKHVFPAIVLPFKPSDKSEKNCLPWKILCCLSYFHYDRIPLSVLVYCCHLLCENKRKISSTMNEVVVGRLVSKLIEHNICSETNKKEITFHEVVSNAFRLNRHSVLEQPFNPLKKAIEVMSGLVSKDMRKRGHSEQMRRLLRHLDCLLEHVDKEENLFDGEDCIMLKALTSHLYETAAAIMLNVSPSLFWEKSESYLKKALSLIWENEGDWHYSSKKTDPAAVAKQIVEESIKKGQSLPTNFTLEYASKLEICFDDKEINFLKSKSSDQACFEEIKKLIKSKTSNRTLLEKLQKCKLFLPNAQYASIFYAERVASILHSYSRHVLYSEIVQNHEDNKCMWMSWLSNCIAIECRKTCGVSLLTEYLSQSGGLVPIVLKMKKKSIDENLKARDFCTATLLEGKETHVMYENGLLKELFGPSEFGTRIALLRSITRIDTRLAKSPHKFNDADKFCNDLFQLSVKHFSELISCAMCIIYCAKYYAATNDHEKSIKCFDKFFEIAVGESVRSNIRCWAVYNYARAIWHFPELKMHADCAFKKCEAVLCSEEAMSMTKDIKNHLVDLKQKLSTITD